MPPDVLAPSTSATRWSRLTQAYGEGVLPPPRYRLRVRPRGETTALVWSVRSFELDERLHGPYALNVLADADADADPEALLGARVELEVARGESTRVVHGVVLESDLLGGGSEGPSVRLYVGPALALLGLYRRSRIFQGQTVPEIVRAVVQPLLVELGSSLDVDRLSSSYAPRDYCVQYRETDLAFVLRILAEAGITLLFHHGEHAEQVVLVDSNQALPPAGCEPLGEGTDALPPSLPFVPARAHELPVESIQGLRQRSRLLRRRWTADAWDWKDKPPTLLRCAHGFEGAGSFGGWWETDEGRPDEGDATNGPIDESTMAQVHRQQRRDHARGVELQAQSNATALRAGSVFELEQAPQDGYDATWVVTRVRHFGDAPHAAVNDAAYDAKAEYANEIECQPHRLPVLPPRPPRPHVPGTQTAIVTGPPGEQIHTDAFGRIRVRMHWDDAPHEGEETSCWLRVALPWAGDDFGMVFIPRVGTEVVVGFIDGDPDRPLCTGVVFNGGAMPSYPLPDNKTRTVLRTRSTDGQGYNELSFQDAGGAEEIYLHAQRDLREHVRAEHMTYVAGNRRSAVCGRRSTSVGKDDHLSISGDHQQVVAGNVTQHFKGACRVRVSEGSSDPNAERAVGGDTGMTITVERGTFEVDAADAVVLRCGESRIELQRGQIVLTSPQILARCSTTAEPHPTSLTLAAGGIDVSANELREHVVVAQTRADSRIEHVVGPEPAKAALTLADDAVKLEAKRVDVASSTVSVYGEESLVLDGATTGIHGLEVSIDAEQAVEITTRGEVVIIGNECINLN